jgi:glyoxylase-like metal-dependent hydrolase (beta-lactamase superfamily II)
MRFKIGYAIFMFSILTELTGLPTMLSLKKIAVLTLLFIFVGSGFTAEPALPDMKFKDVKEVAPGVFFRFSSISATDKTVPFGGSNNIWVVFEDHVAVIDANFPDGAADVVAAIRKTTNKPIRYVFDTHHHGDHAYGNSVFFKEGATVVAQANCARLMREFGPAEFDEAGKGPTGRKDVASSFLKTPGIVFDDRLVLDDGKQRVEFLFMGHAHTAGDAVAWLPKHGILCTGDACVNGAYNFMGHSDSGSWVKALEKMADLKPKMVCPGHGPVAGADLIQKQKRYFVDLRDEVDKGIKQAKDLKSLQDSIKFPWYEQWTGVPVKPDNIEHVYKELTGMVVPHDLLRDLSYVSGNYTPEKPKTGWVAPKRVILSSGFMPARIAELKAIAPDIEFVAVPTLEEAGKAIMNADAVLGFADSSLLQSGNKLRWIQSGPDLPKDFLANAKTKGVQVTSLDRAALPAEADQALRNLLWVAQQGNADGLQGKNVAIYAPAAFAKIVSNRVQNFGAKISINEMSPTMGGTDVMVVYLNNNKQANTLANIPWAGLKQGGSLIIMGDATGLNAEAITSGIKSAKAQLVAVDLKGFQNPEAIAKEQGVGKVHLVEKNTVGSTSVTERKWKLLRENVRRFSTGEPLLAIIDSEDY